MNTTPTLLPEPLAITCRHFFAKTARGLGAIALGSLLPRVATAQGAGGLPGLPNFAPKAKRVIYLFQSGAPSQIDLFDHKPQLEKQRGRDLPDSIRGGQRLTGMTSGQKNFPIAPSIFKFPPQGERGTRLSE